MHFEGRVEIAAPRDKVWSFVIDPTAVGQCGPGVETVEAVDDSHFKARAKVGIGFISARFVTEGEMTVIAPSEHAEVKVHGQAPGSAADAVATIKLGDGAAGTTIMDWSAEVNISGVLASVGARLIEGTANKLIAQTFECMKTKLEG
jgi:carbon monoxide dehydrogenase subunit G